MVRPIYCSSQACRLHTSIGNQTLYTAYDHVRHLARNWASVGPDDPMTYERRARVCSLASPIVRCNSTIVPSTWAHASRYAYIHARSRGRPARLTS